MALLRDMRVWDANMFVTAWTIDVLLESVQQGIISPIPQANLTSACEALQSYHDQNYPDGVPSYVFWPQIERPAGSGVYVCWPPNMEDILAMTGVTVDDDESQLRAFFIPSDFDDIGVCKKTNTKQNLFHLFLFEMSSILLLYPSSTPQKVF